MTMRAAVERGIAAGAAATMAQGTGLPRVEDVERLHAAMRRATPQLKKARHREAPGQ